MSMFTKQDGEAGLVNDVIIGGVLSSSTGWILNRTR